LKLPWRDKNQNWSHMFLGEVFKHRVHVDTNADDDDVMMMMSWWWCHDDDDDDDDDDPNETCQFRDKISSRNWHVLPT